MYSNKRIFSYILLLILGAGILAAAAAGAIDSYWGGFGGGFMGVAAVRLAISRRYHKNPDYARQVDVANADERNRYVSGLARSWTFA